MKTVNNFHISEQTTWMVIAQYLTLYLKKNINQKGVKVQQENALSIRMI